MQIFIFLLSSKLTKTNYVLKAMEFLEENIY